MGYRGRKRRWDRRPRALEQPPWTVTTMASRVDFYLKPGKKALENFKQRSSMTWALMYFLWCVEKGAENIEDNNEHSLPK